MRISMFTQAMKDDWKREVIAEIASPDLDPVVDWAFAHAAEKGFDVIHISPGTGTESKINWDEHAIYLNPKGASGVARLWDLLHELGHLVDGRPVEDYVPARNKASWQRETRAWNLGWVTASDEYPVLSDHSVGFTMHAGDLLKKSYRPDDIDIEYQIDLMPRRAQGFSDTVE
jgi:hypothetical protein